MTAHFSKADDSALRVRRLLAIAVIPFLGATLVGLVVLWPSHHTQAVPTQFETTDGKKPTFLTGHVARIDVAPCGSSIAGGPTGSGQCQEIRVALNTSHETVTIEGPSPPTATAPRFTIGDNIRVGKYVDPVTGGPLYQFDDFVRDKSLAMAAVVFCVLVIAVARWRGLAALGGLVFAYGVLVEFLIPALLAGKSPIGVALTASSAIIFVVLYLAHGFTVRTTTALLGTLLSLCLAALVSAVLLHSSHITGLTSEENTTLQTIAGNVSLTGLLLCGFVIGSLGVLNDVTVTQASAAWELQMADPDTGATEVFARAMRIGRDHIASSVYTLVLAYAGAALPILLLSDLSGRSLHDLVTGETVGTEVLRALIGGSCLVLAVPVTTALAAAVVTTPRSKRIRPKRSQRRR